MRISSLSPNQRKLPRLPKLPQETHLYHFTTVSILYFSMYFSLCFSLVRTVEQTSLSENVCELDFLNSINQLDEYKCSEALKTYFGL